MSSHLFSKTSVRYKVSEDKQVYEQIVENIGAVIAFTRKGKEIETKQEVERGGLITAVKYSRIVPILYYSTLNRLLTF